MTAEKIIRKHKAEFEKYFLNCEHRYSIEYVSVFSMVIIKIVGRKNKVITFNEIENWHNNLKLLEFVNHDSVST